MSITENSIEGRIAVIGMAGRFPQAKDIEAFWDNLKNGVESIADLTDAELLAAGESQSQIDSPLYVKRGVVLEDADKFDANFFGYTPKEAEIMDPQQRIFLEIAYHALENAGYSSGDSEQRIGVFAGASLPSYLIHNLLSNPDLGDHGNDLTVRLGNDKDFLATRVSYKLNFKGPSININTACSTSLVAIHTACQNLLNYQCDMALAGGITVKSPQKSGYLYQTGGISSPDGHCRAFDADAQGTIGGSGAGIVVLKRLEDALEDGDTIDAVICGSAINNDGAQKVGFTAPSVNGQAEVIAEAQAVAGFEPRTFSYIEAHGTGTSLGDPIEIEALTQAFRLGSEDNEFCAIGSVKTNVGHLDAAAGVCGLIKTVLALKNQELPASLHFKKPNPDIDFANSPFYVNQKNQPWKASPAHPRRAGVSSFGIGGTNAHVVLEEAPAPPTKSTETIPAAEDAHLCILSAKTPEAVDALSKNLAKHLSGQPEVDLKQVSWTLARGREAHSHRTIVTAQNRQELLDGLNSPKPSVAAPNTPPAVAFLFTGQGAQYVEMGAGLYQSEPAFKQNIDTCADIIKALTGEDLREVLFPSTETRSAMSEALKQTAVAQPALFAIEYSLARLWISWGIQPSAMLGHSIGEYVAACIADVMSLESALMLVTERGRLMQSVAPGSMLAVSLSEAAIKPYLNEGLELAAINGINNCVISGQHPEIQVLLEKLEEQEIGCSLLHTSHAFHSFMMEPIIDSFREKVAATPLQAPKIPFVSNVSGQWITPEEATSPDYWAKHLRQPVRFYQGLETARSQQDFIFLEVGPGNTLTTLGKRHLDQTEGCTFLTSLRHPRENTQDRIHLLSTLGSLWKLGVPIDWNNVYSKEAQKRIHLPTYPFARKRYWIERNSSSATRSLSEEMRGLPPKNKDVGQWFSVPSWRQEPLAQRPKTAIDKKTWVIFQDGKGIGNRLQKELKDLGHTVISVSAGAQFKLSADGDIQMNLANTTDYDQLATHLGKYHTGSINFINMACIPATQADDLWSVKRIEASTERGCASLLFLAQALRVLSGEFTYRIDVITDSMQQAFGQKTRNPECATVLGPVKVIPQESMNLSCRSIDLDLETLPFEQQLPSLMNELLWPNDANIILLRHGQRWIETYESITLPSPQDAPIRFKKNGAYLITGGLGRVGLTLAHYLAENYQARLVLLGRTALPPREQWPRLLEKTEATESMRTQITRVIQLEALGSKVLCLAVDVSDETQMSAALVESEKQFQELNGIIHTAGITSGKSIFTPFDELGVSELESQFQPKVHGTLTLYRLLKDRPMDFCLLLSSNASVLGGLGLAAYSAANAFLDTFAQSLHGRTKTPFISSNWDGWPKLEADNTPTEHQTSIEAYSMTRAEAEIAFASIISQTGTYPQFAVSSGHLGQRIAAGKRNISSGNNESAIDHDTPPRATHQRPNISSEYLEPSTETENALARIWQNLIGIQSIGVLDNFFELGGDSLLGTQLISRANKQFRIQLPLRSLFEELTIQNLALRIEKSYLTSDQPDEVEDIRPIPDKEAYALSFAQRRLWLVCQMSGASVAYNLKYALMLEGEIDRDAFESAFAHLVGRHESLRTQFLVQKGEPIQCVRPKEQVDFKVGYHDLTKDPKPETAAHVLAKSEALKPFDLQEDLLIRVSLLELPTQQQAKRHVMLFNMHHIISDGWSLKVLVQELSQSYNQLITVGEVSLPSLPIQYRDYAAWQNELFSADKTSAQEQYWLKQLAGEIPAMELPFDFPRPDTQTFNGSYLVKKIPSEKYGKLIKFNQQNNTSLYVTLLAGLNLALHHHSNQEDILIGSPVAGRNRIELENQIGFYLNTVAMRNAVDPDMTFGELLQSVRQTATDAFDHQDYPFDQLVEKLGGERDQSRSPLFDVMLNLVLDDEELALNIEGLSVSSFGNTSQGSLFDLNFMWAQTDGHLELWLHYNTDLFKEVTVASMAADYLTILDMLVEDPDALDKVLSTFLTTKEKQQEEAVFMDAIMDLNEDF